MGHYFVLIGLATFKFMFAPLYGLMNHLSFIESYLCTLAGGFVSATAFYWPAEIFMARAHKKRKEKLRKSLESGKKIAVQKNMTRTNKMVVKIKRSIGIWGIALYVPLFLSVPIGSIITAKFYGKDKRTFYIVLLGLAMNGFIFSLLFYLFK
jgi:hypothetical protein